MQKEFAQGDRVRVSKEDEAHVGKVTKQNNQDSKKNVHLGRLLNGNSSFKMVSGN